MSGAWESRLDNLAHGGRDWALPSHEELTSNLDALRGSLSRAASDPGLVGDSGTAATASLDEAAKRADAIIATADAVHKATEKANVVRTRAQGALAELPDGELSWGERALIGAAAAGSTIFLGPFSLVAGVAAMNNGDAAKAAMREAAAKKAVREASADLAQIDLPTEVEVDGSSTVFNRDSGGGGPRQGSPDGGFSSYPDYDVDPISSAGQRPGVSIVTPGTVPPPGSTIIPTEPGPWPQGPTDHGSSGLVGAGGASVGGLGGSGGLLGGSNTLAAGAGAAAVLGLGAKGALGSFGALSGGAGKGVAAGGLTGTPGANAAAGAGRGAAASGPRAGSGGLLGGGGRAGAGAASERSGTRAGGRGRGTGRVAGGKAGLVDADGVTRGPADAAGSAGRGAGRPGGVGAESAGRAGAQGAAGVRAGGAASGRGSAEKRRRGRGLAGAIAPSIEDEIEYGPRSEAALAGERDQTVDEIVPLASDAD
ncbi:MAG: hypothetical protein J0I43_09645 [Microbacterium sp.]|uniref:hypothetical protein n=1 Tax=Microbacterium sp. TaxID=51671 RepID=UPI001ACBE8D1|nr:hypothetical protein [Microbacterium sp.]MBN9177614.1 hypothetical protein [Microbacterium sp.]